MGRALVMTSLLLLLLLLLPPPTLSRRSVQHESRIVPSAFVPPPPSTTPEELSLHTVSVVVLHTYLTPLAQAALVVHGVQGSLPVPENDEPPMHVATAPVQTMSAPGTHAVLTPVGHVDAVAHRWHGALPDEDHVEPSSHDPGVPPPPPPVPPEELSKHTVSVVVLHTYLTPLAQASVVHAVHGSLPDTENDVPPTQGATAPVQTVSAPGTQAVLTPVGGAVLNLLSQVYGRVVLVHLFDAPAGGLPAVKASSHTVLPPTQATYQLSPFAGALGVIFAVPLQALLSLHLSTTFSARPVTSKSWQASDPKHSIKHFEAPGLLQVMTELPLQALFPWHWMRHPLESLHVYFSSWPVIIFVVIAGAAAGHVDSAVHG